MLDFGNVSTMPVKDMKSDDSLGQKASSRRCPVDLKGTSGCPMGLMGPGGDELMLEVTCGQNQAALYMSRLQLGSKGTCVLFENSWLTPNEFQYISGRETAKDWKRSIKHHGKSLKVLISKGILATSPLRCNCGQCAQSKEKDVFKYIVTDDVKMTPASTLRDVFTTDASKLVKSERTKDASDRKLFGAPGESNENKKDAPSESTTNALQRPSAEKCLTSHSPGGARLASLSEKSAYTGPTKDVCFRSNVGDTYRVEQSVHLANKANNKMSCEDTDSKLKTKKRMEGNENEELSKDGSRIVQDGDQRKLGTESIKTSVSESPAAGGTSQKRSASSGNKLVSGAAGDWSQTIANYSPHQSESTVSKSSPHDKTRKSTSSSHPVPSCTAEKPTCIQVNASSSGKTSDTGVSVSNPARPSPSESSFVFPSFGSPYYPMIPAPQLPAYYANPYMWPLPFATNPSACAYGWTEPSEIAAASRLLSPTKDSLERTMANVDQAFNFPWMKRLNCSSADRETAETGSSSGKRKLDCDPAEYLLPAKHRLLLADGLRSMYGDAVGWPGYGANAASAINFRFLPYNIPSYIPDVRPTHGLYASNFVKGCESPSSSSGLGLFPGLFPSQCLGVNSR